MKTFLVIVFMFAGLLFYPQIQEGTDSSCAALERKVLSVVNKNNEGAAFVGLLLKGLSNGAFAREAIKSEYPNLPPIMGCSISYYDVLLNPERALKLKPK
tara:strand:+ start:103 stop:402 length:300 start_codon:yes stop_codon:yes gene_type:complete